MSTSRDNAAAALASTDWTDGVLVTDDTPRGASTVQSTRMSGDLTRRLFAEAARRRIKPSELIRDLVVEGLDAADAGDNTPITIGRADLHRALDTVLRDRAA
jgi:hypothetical protein